jgi:hypothetical protein
VRLRAETHRLSGETQVARLDHVARRKACLAELGRVREVRERVPTWPAWSGPAEDLRLTLVRLK